jgi:hypothetical protein
MFTSGCAIGASKIQSGLTSAEKRRKKKSNLFGHFQDSKKVVKLVRSEGDKLRTENESTEYRQESYIQINHSPFSPNARTHRMMDLVIFEN